MYRYGYGLTRNRLVQPRRIGAGFGGFGPLTAGLLGAGIGYLGGELLDGPDYGGYGYPGVGPGYGGGYPGVGAGYGLGFPGAGYGYGPVGGLGYPGVGTFPGYGPNFF